MPNMNLIDLRLDLENSNTLLLIIAQGQKLFYTDEKKRTSNTIIGITCGRPKRRKRARIEGYGDVIEMYLGDDFKSHFRMHRCTMELLIRRIGSNIVNSISKVGRPRETVKFQCLIAVWVLANQESYRFVYYLKCKEYTVLHPCIFIDQ